MRFRHSLQARSSFLLCLFFVALYGSARLAIEKRFAEPLPDDQIGSTAKSLTKVGAGTLGVVGSKQKGDGTVGAIYWNIVTNPIHGNPNDVYAIEPRSRRAGMRRRPASRC